jgi:hypothetical protein
MQLLTNARLDSSVSAASEKYFDQVQPPSAMCTRSCGYFALSCRSWLKLPASGWLNSSATPDTVCSALNLVW